MIKLCTPVEMPTHLPLIRYEDLMMMLGSCFSESLGKRLRQAKFGCDVNPYGTLYNPLSISRAMNEIISGKLYQPQDLFFYRGCWHSAMHHGDFSHSRQEETLALINNRLEQAHSEIQSLKYLFVTFGSAWVYEKDGEIVGNCHKLPEREFVRRRLGVEEIVEEYCTVLHRLWQLHPQVQVIFTVSPIRHLRDGLHGNQLSKATLLLAIDRLQQEFKSQVYYFPAYEMLMDELRDYRFYAEDLTHPAEVAVNIVWERFVQTFFGCKTQEQLAEVETVNKMLQHRPLHESSEEYEDFVKKLLEKLDVLTEKYPGISWEKEKKLCCTKLGK